MTRGRSLLARLYKPQAERDVRALFARRAREAADPGPQMSLSAFMREAWREIEPSQLAWNWHLEAQCDHAEAVTRGDVRRLLVNVPPGSSKSLVWAVFWPAWEWTRMPWTRWLIISVAEQAAVRDSRRFRALIGSRWYRSRWPRVVAQGDEAAVDAIGNTLGGKRYLRPMQGTLTSLRGDRLIIDDPQAVTDTLWSPAYRKSIVERVTGEAMSRVNDEKTSPIVVVQQRVHMQDVSAALIAAGGWERLSIPMQRTEAHAAKFAAASGWSDDPRPVGEYMHPARFGEAEAAPWKARSRHWTAQYQQRPEHDDGVLIRREWVQHWRPTQLPARFARLITSWDLTLGKARRDVERGEKEGRRSYVVGQVWGEHAGHYYLLDQVRGQWDAVQQLGVMVETGTRPALGWLARERDVGQQPTAHYVEDTVLGPTAAAALRSRLPGIVLVPVEGMSKEARVDDVLGLWASGSVWLPPVDLCPWMAETLARIVAFPGDDPDDEVDAMSQALRVLRRPGVNPTEWSALVDAAAELPSAYAELRNRY